MANIIEYIKKIWKYGDRVTPTDLNNIETGIKNNNDAISVLNSDLADIYPNTYNSTPVRIGTFMGRPLYRKVISGLSISTGTSVDWVEVCPVPSGLVDIINCYGRYNRIMYYFRESGVRYNNVAIITNGINETIDTIIIEYTI